MANAFSLILVIVTLVTGVIWVLEKFYLAKQRQTKLAKVESQTNELEHSVKDKVLSQPWWVENSVSIFPVIAAVLIIRSFIYEPFQIPSGSMMPTLLVGDFILVEKFAYGLNDPVFHKELIATGSPKRGDIVVFRYPVDPSLDYIKRVVGLPGDIVRYTDDKQLCIIPKGESQCNVVPTSNMTRTDFTQMGLPLIQKDEQLGNVKHHILINPELPNPRYMAAHPAYDVSQWVVPKDHYFMMGDNRDNSEDSRFWGFVPKQNLVGKAVAIWISFEFDRDKNSILPSWIPTGVRFNRIGGIE